MWKLIFIIFGIIIILSIISFVCNWFGGAAQVAQEQFSARALLTKYEMFKDESAQLDKKIADSKVYQSRVTNLEKQYVGVARNKWTRADAEQYNVWQSEVEGIKASYNSLAADYNAQMSKFNYRFTNVGDLPQGATEPLPREYKPYITE